MQNSYCHLIHEPILSLRYLEKLYLFVPGIVILTKFEDFGLCYSPSCFVTPTQLVQRISCCNQTTSDVVTHLQ